MHSEHLYISRDFLKKAHSSLRKENCRWHHFPSETLESLYWLGLQVLNNPENQP